MIDVYDQVTSENISFDEIGKSIPDPFFDPTENHILIGVASIHLRPLFHNTR